MLTIGRYGGIMELKNDKETYFMAKVSTNITIDAEVKARAQALLSDFGMDLSTAVNIFLRQMVYDGAFPFPITRCRRSADESAASVVSPSPAPNYDEEFMRAVSLMSEPFAPSVPSSEDDGADFELSFPTIPAPELTEFPEDDELLLRALDIAVAEGKIMTSLLQRRLQIGYGRAARIIDRLEELGYVSAAEGNKPRRVNITREIYEKFLKESAGVND